MLRYPIERSKNSMQEYRSREAQADDFAVLVKILADDELGQTRGSTGRYRKRPYD